MRFPVKCSCGTAVCALWVSIFAAATPLGAQTAANLSADGAMAAIVIPSMQASLSASQGALASSSGSGSSRTQSLRNQFLEAGTTNQQAATGNRTAGSFSASSSTVFLMSRSVAGYSGAGRGQGFGKSLALSSPSAGTYGGYVNAGSPKTRRTGGTLGNSYVSSTSTGSSVTGGASSARAPSSSSLAGRTASPYSHSGTPGAKRSGVQSFGSPIDKYSRGDDKGSLYERLKSPQR